MEKKRILHILVSNRYSGAENIACQIIHMFRNDENVEMAYCSPDGPVREALDERGVEFIPLQAATFAEVKRAIKTYKPTLIHAHDMRASFLVALTCGKIPFVSHIHNNGFASRGLTLKAVLYRLAAAKARHVFWVSKAAFEGYYFHSAIEKKSSVLYNVIDVQQLEEKAEQAECQTVYDVVFLGRMAEPKNPRRLIEVLQKCVEKNSELSAALVGSGEMDQEVRNLLEEKGLTDNIHFLGFMSNPYGILKNSKVMIMTSLWEGLPMCALEAMALGVPIVSTPTDGMKELIEDGKTGFLSDNDEVLVARILQILQTPKLGEEMSLCAKNKSIQINDIEVYCQGLVRVYGINC